MNPSAIDILVGALTIHGEARGCTQEGRTAIAHVILNRAKNPSWWCRGVDAYPDHSIASVCLKPYQFSCWNPNDPNHKLLTSLQRQYQEAIQERDCRNSLKALIDAVDGWLPDPTLGATHYLTTRLHLSPSAPAWSRRDDYIEIGAHRFFGNVK